MPACIINLLVLGGQENKKTFESTVVLKYLLRCFDCLNGYFPLVSILMAKAVLQKIIKEEK